jgi:hypothetical protein
MGKVEDILFSPVRVFDYIDVADQECKAVGDQDMFLYMIPKGPLRSARIDIYRHHVRELLSRKGTDVPISVPTKAEVLMQLSEATFEKRLKGRLESLYFGLSHELVPDKAAEIDLPLGSVDEDDLEEARRWVHQYRPATWL